MSSETVVEVPAATDEITVEQKQASYVFGQKLETEEMAILGGRFFLGDVIATPVTLGIMNSMGGVDVSKLSFLKSGAFWASNIIGSTVATLVFIASGTAVFYGFVKPAKEKAQAENGLTEIEWEQLSDADKEALKGFKIPAPTEFGSLYARFLPSGVVTFGLFNAMLPLANMALQQVAPGSVVGEIAKDGIVASAAGAIFYAVTRALKMKLPTHLMPGAVAGLFTTPMGMAAAESIISAIGIDGFWAQTAVRTVMPALTSAAGVLVATGLDRVGSRIIQQGNLDLIAEGKKPIGRVLSYFWSQAKCAEPDEEKALLSSRTLIN